MSAPGDGQPRRQDKGKKSLSRLFSEVTGSMSSGPPTKRPTTINLDNPHNTASLVPGQQQRWNPEPVPKDRGIGFASLNNRSPAATEPQLPAWIRERDRRMAEDPSRPPAGYPFGRPHRPRPVRQDNDGDDGDNDDADADDVSEDNNPPPAARGRKPIHYGAPPLPSADRKQRRAKGKDKAAAPKKVEYIDNVFPLSPATADEADRMVYQMGGRMKRDWREAYIKWEQITGKKSPTDLTNRFHMMITNFAMRGVLDLPEEVLRTYPPSIGQDNFDINAIVQKDQLLARLKEEVEKEQLQEDSEIVWALITERYNRETGRAASGSELQTYWADSKRNLPMGDRLKLERHKEAERAKANRKKEKASRRKQPKQSALADLAPSPRDKPRQSALADLAPSRQEEPLQMARNNTQKSAPAPLVDYPSDSD